MKRAYSFLLSVSLIATVTLTTISLYILLASENPLNNQNELVAEATEYPFRLTMTIPKDSYKLGEPVNITFRVEHIGNENLTLVFSDGHERCSYIVYDENNSVIYDKDLDTLYPQLYHPEDVEPGDSWTKFHGWDQIDGLVVQWDKDPPSYYKRVPQGTYYIVGMFKSDTLNLTVETAPIAITILEGEG